ncbi:RNA polymerase sigma factor [Fulvivirga marina]|nr:sigma-70 family RNA polymerase sigma factor [Fulvivirga marina]
MTGRNITFILNGCLNNDRQCQKELYRQLHGFAMSVCYRYADVEEQCVDLVNKGFLKLLNKLNQIHRNGDTDTMLLLKEQFKLILINICVEHYHKIKGISKDHDNNMSHEQLTGKPIEAIRSLSPINRMVFNLYAIEGYGHMKISKILGISLNDSQFCLMQARNQLREQVMVSKPATT